MNTTELEKELTLLKAMTNCQVDSLCIKIKELEAKINNLNKESFAFEEGKFYKTRNGNKMIVISINPSKDVTNPIFGAIIGDSHTETWNRKGEISCGSECVYDIISEWKE